ncbi:MAG: cysteine--tRNA ligase [Verrucomicrobiae bacterium]|nr:cysteine--tRNA ligase [Verrucomicrobiae bacterium]
MALRFFNTLTRNLDEFRPLDPAGRRVTLYTCGPTVYDYAHIGNFRAFTFEDLLRRWLAYRGYEVLHVMNITDVEDKIIRKVRETGETLKQLTERYTTAFLEDCRALNVLPPHHMPRATEHIPEMLRLIGALMEKGVAYQASDKSVYFSITKFPRYGQLKKIDSDQMRPGARVKQDEYEKESVADFALWKAWDEADGDIAWDSPWGRGRPGWHIECSAMSMKYLGESFDLHCGGEDLVFPHHEDEIAQSEAATGKQFVRYWLHCAYLLVNGQKMSKRFGKFFTLRDLLAKGYTGRELRYILIGEHYRRPLNFTLEGLDAARSSLARIDELLAKLQDVAGSSSPDSTAPSSVAQVTAEFESALDDDLNISAGLGALFNFIRDTNKRLAANAVLPAEAAAMLAAWRRFDTVLGLGMPQRDAPPAEVVALAEQRQAARKAKDFQRADALRDELKSRGWVVEDTPAGPKLKKMSA